MSLPIIGLLDIKHMEKLTNNVRVGRGFEGYDQL